MLRDLFEELDEPAGLPLIKGERCVHALVENASCSACADVCPKDAWIVNDESVALDTNQCDGCGLCVPVCTEGAIKHDYKLQFFTHEDQITAFVVCEYADTGNDLGRVPCIHSFGLSELLGIYRRGVRKLLVSTADCEQCPRGGSECLTDRVSALNEMLLQRGKPKFTLDYVPPHECTDLIKQFLPLEQKKISRRNFFRTGSRKLLQYKSDIYDLAKGEHLSPGNLLRREQDNDMSVFSPRLDAKLCIGCDACFRVCPHNALQIVDDNNEMYYQIEDDNCTACRLCTDICEEDAIRLEKWYTGKQDKVLLLTMRCKACGASYHVPNKSTSVNELCPICAKHNHVANLYQVME